MSDRQPPDGTVRTRTIEVDYLARVEGEGALDVRIVDGRVEELKLRIFEPPRYFEGILRGRGFAEAPDITARICGICPVAYQMSACHAMERACGVRVDGPLRALRRLLYCGEWIQSHALHIYMLHAPDFLGTADAIEVARQHPEIVQRGLRLRGVGNKLIATLGGRQVAPVNVRVGGFYRLPEDAELEALVGPLREARDAAVETVRWTAGFTFPELEHDYEFVALRDGERYPMNEGRLISSSGLDIDQADFEDHFEERHVAHSTALHAYRRGGGSYHKYVQNFCLALCADGKDLSSGYALIFGGDKNTRSMIVRDGKVVAEAPVGIPARRNIHRKWFRLRGERLGNRIRFSAFMQDRRDRPEDQLLRLEYEDPDPLPGTRVAVWTYNNGMLLARTRIASASIGAWESALETYPAESRCHYTRNEE